MREQLVELIVRRLDDEKDRIAADFAADKGINTRFAAIDDLLVTGQTGTNVNDFRAILIR